ncbi:hypothetical protein [Methylobacterium radiotolerans]|uniref:hypothetical protein n=1 Tax=Methylobacterium radiotolerans TaxID=31998 RepID=UPI000D5E567F|nr:MULTISPECIES: hypothetical protein [Methylobacterium]MDE3748577.1 hypothetical protein [Methylobacterium radiotolerans]PVY93704.1 ElaB/YqjD/DUF883 family membrane-anchored ribosome-binding protein [Methylobacterium organophilum]
MTDKPGTPSSTPEQLAAEAGMPHGGGDKSLRPDPTGLGDPGAPGTAAGDFTLRPDPRGLHDPLQSGAATGSHDAAGHDAASAAKDGIRAAGDRATELAGQARRTVSGLADDINDRLGGAADQARDRASAAYDDARERAGALHRRNMRALDDLTNQGIAGINRGRTAVERFVDDNPLLVGVVGVAAGLLLGALLPRTRQEDRSIGPWADEVRDQGLRYAREVTNIGREFVQTALDPDNLNAAARKVADPEGHKPPEGERTQHNL